MKKKKIHKTHLARKPQQTDMRGKIKVDDVPPLFMAV
jgi:hypothetical protein